MTTGDDRHMPWPNHDHDQYGNCRIELFLGDRHLTAAEHGLQPDVNSSEGVSTATLQGVPCDHCAVEVDALLTSAEELTLLRRALDQLEAPFAAGRAEADCVGHDHSDD